ncbi:MAG: hypothetical protein R3F23_08270 [Verrucomicrobiia bacterium]
MLHSIPTRPLLPEEKHALQQTWLLYELLTYRHPMLEKNCDNPLKPTNF